MGKLASWRVVSCVLSIAMPLSLLASDSAVAMLFGSGAYLNGAKAPSSSAIFSGDLVQTPADAPANIHMLGSSITVLNDSLVKVAAGALDLDHGGIQVATAKGVAATVGDLRVAPVSSNWTEFNVSDTNGLVRILARKGDLAITDESGTMRLPEGQQATRDDSASQSASSDQNDTNKKKKKKRAAAAVPAAQGGALSSPIVDIAGGAAVGGVLVWVFTRGDDAISPTKPGCQGQGCQ